MSSLQLSSSSGCAHRLVSRSAFPADASHRYRCLKSHIVCKAAGPVHRTACGARTVQVDNIAVIGSWPKSRKPNCSQQSCSLWAYQTPRTATAASHDAAETTAHTPAAAAPAAPPAAAAAQQAAVGNKQGGKEAVQQQLSRSIKSADSQDWEDAWAEAEYEENEEDDCEAEREAAEHDIEEELEDEIVERLKSFLPSQEQQVRVEVGSQLRGPGG